jgi:hypothetical protein
LVDAIEDRRAFVTGRGTGYVDGVLPYGIEFGDAHRLVLREEIDQGRPNGRGVITGCRTWPVIDAAHLREGV